MARVVADRALGGPGLRRRGLRPTTSSRHAPALTGRPLRLLIAADVGPVRLIDNLDPARDAPLTPAP